MLTTHREVVPSGDFDLITDGLVLRLQLDEASGSTEASDSTGNGHEGTLSTMDVNAVWGSPGQRGTCVSFLDSDPDSHQIYWPSPRHEVFKIDPPFTYCFFFKGTQDVGQCAFVLSNNSASNYMTIYLGEGITGGYEHEIITVTTVISDASKDVIYVLEPDRNQLFDGQWHPIVLRNDGTKWEIFLNGVNKELTGTKNIGSAPPQAATTARLGTRYFGAYTLPLKGQVDEFRFYNNAMTDQDVAKYSAGNG